MMLTVELPDELVLVLGAKAKTHGLSAERYAQCILEHDLMPGWLQKSWDSAKQTGLDRLSIDEIDAEIAAARA